MVPLVLMNMAAGPIRLPPGAVNNCCRNAGSDSTFVLSDAQLWLDVEESNGRGWRGQYGAKAREYGSPLFPVLRVDPV